MAADGGDDFGENAKDFQRALGEKTGELGENGGEDGGGERGREGGEKVEAEELLGLERGVEELRWKRE